jgi:hypothetical protein
MCWVTVAGHGAVFKPSAFEKPTPGEAMLMKDTGLGGKMVCVECRGALQRYFNMDKGPMCPRSDTSQSLTTHTTPLLLSFGFGTPFSTLFPDIV